MLKHAKLAVWLTFSVTASAIAATRGPMPGVTSNSAYTIYYGDDYYTGTESPDPDAWQINQDTLNRLSGFDIVILQPNQPHCTPEIIKLLKDNGVDYVLGYISVGEDFIDDAMETPLSGSGMVALQNGRLAPVQGNTLASFYVDVDSQAVTYNEQGTAISVTTTERLTPDGLPDYNPVFLGYMVNPDSNWRWVIDHMRIGRDDVPGRSTKAGLKQIAGHPDVSGLRDRSNNYGFDGFFLDTIDTAGPYNAPGWYPWTVEAMRDTIRYISDRYPDKIVYANRGSFYFSAGLKSSLTHQYPIDYTIRPYINAYLFESFRYDSNPAIDGPNGVSEFYGENRYNIAPKVFAEANRPDGFTVFSLEYESGRDNIVWDALNVDVFQLGFVAYLTDDRPLDTIDLDFKWHLPATDFFPPVWDSSGHMNGAVNTYFRVGVQEIEKGNTEGQVIARWDVAVDQSYPLTYDLIVTEVDTGAETVYPDVMYSVDPDWNHDPVENFANQYTIQGLNPGSAYNIRVVAKDATGLKNTEDPGLVFTLSDLEATSVFKNPVIRNPVPSGFFTVDGALTEWMALSAYPDDPDDIAGLSPAGHISGSANQANWRGIQVAHTTDTDQLFMAYTNQTNTYISWGFQVFIDADENPDTGFRGTFGGIEQFPIGADYLIEGVDVYDYNGSGLDWNWLPSAAAGGYEVGRRTHLEWHFW